MRVLRVQVWSDVACPWCYVGKRRLDAATGRLPPDVTVQATWRSFELDPAAPRAQPSQTSYAARLARKYGTSEPEAQVRVDHMTEVGRADGIAFRFDRVRPGNTFDAHRLLHLARTAGLQDALVERLFRGYFGEGEAIGDPDTLARLALEAGLVPGEIARVLAGEGFAAEVRADENEAQRLGIHGVPFFVFQERFAVSGAQPADVLADAMVHAVSHGGAHAVDAGAPACGAGGCD